jgi:hypothetical protein
MVCALDINTTGPDPRLHEIVQIVLIPLTPDYEISRTLLPFMATVKPDREHTWTGKAPACTRPTLSRALRVGADPADVVGALFEWKEKRLGLWYNGFGIQKKIIPLGHNICGLALPFLRQFMGESDFNDFFHWEPRDTMIAGLFLNDHCNLHAEMEPYNRVYRLSAMCNIAGLPYERLDSAANDAKAARMLWKHLCQRSVFK